ncbi:hypothetical protein [Gorillibacterium massiliense]|uniref:hypothetical protein n=1 Tax=Gorillibacterium massiliense TaxID=1280390 RepID=UPI0004AF1CCD|nr:hypothetical protein [Gorillibacterium massiliense]
MAAGCGLLAAGLWLMRHLPSRSVRGVSAIAPVLSAFFTLKFIGAGIWHLQQAAAMQATPMRGLPEVPLFSFYPTKEGVTGQVLLLLVIIISACINHRRDRAFIRRLNP